MNNQTYSQFIKTKLGILQVFKMKNYFNHFLLIKKL